MIRSRFRSILALGLSLASAVAAAAAVPDNDRAVAIEFYHANFDHYFITVSADEIAKLDNGTFVGWARTGSTFTVVKPYVTTAGASNVCRFYGLPPIDSHFYSADATECAAVQVKFPDAWKLESTEVFQIFAPDHSAGTCPENTKPVYRLWNNKPSGNHRYTTDAGIFNSMKIKGWVPEGYGDSAYPTIFCAMTETQSVAPVPGTPVCTLAGAPSPGFVGVPVTLTATCSNAPTSYSWIGCVSSSNTCVVNSNVGGNATYRLAGINAVGTGPEAALTVNWLTEGPPPTPTNTSQCSLTANPQSQLINNTVLLLASCTANPQSYVWQQCSASLPNMCTPIPNCGPTAMSCPVTNSLIGAAVYAVSANNAMGAGAATRQTVQWTGEVSPPPLPPPVEPRPSCSISANLINPTIANEVVLIADCSGEPFNYSWTGCYDTNGDVCFASSETVGPTTYSMTATNSGGSATASYTVNWRDITQVPECVVNSTSGAPDLNSSITLVPVCTNLPTSYVWTGDCLPIADGGACVATNTSVEETRTYKVVATNKIGPSKSAQTRAAWHAPWTDSRCMVVTSQDSPLPAGSNMDVQVVCSTDISMAWEADCPESYLQFSGDVCRIRRSTPSTEDVFARIRNASGDITQVLKLMTIEWR